MLRRAWLIAAAAALAALLPAQTAEEIVVPLDGVWRIQPPGGEERDISVPAFWDRDPALRQVHRATYRRSFDVSASFKDHRIVLRFDAVGDAAEVSINGQPAGGHIGAALPFEVDITALVAVPSTGNRLEVDVRDDSHFSAPRPAANDFRNRMSWIPRGMGANNRKGLYQSVTLRARPDVWVASAHVRTSIRRREISVVYEIWNGRRDTVRARIASEVPGVVTLAPKDVELPGFVTTTVLLTAPFGPGVTLWQPDHPALYTLRSTLSDAAGAALARADTRFGFREVWFEGIHFYLNGVRANLRGESPAYGEKIDMFSTRSAAERMIRIYQQVNFNVLRFHAMPAPPHVLDLCDELGMLVIDESAIYASWKMLMPEHPRWMDFAREHLARWVRRDRNHPSVVLWSGDNEGLNVNLLSPAMLADFRRVIDAHDGTRPVIFDGDGTGHGASPASNKHYVRVVEDLQDRGGRSSGYSRDLRDDIYWAAAYKHDLPLGIGEFLYPNEQRMRDRKRDALYMMGLQTRGYRLADWFDIRPYNPSYTGFLTAAGVAPEYKDAYEIIVKSFAPVAVFDKDYDALGPHPAPPKLASGQPVRRTLIVYNDAFSDESVEILWRAVSGDREVASGRKTLRIPLGFHTTFDIEFTPGAPGALRLYLESRKSGRREFSDVRLFSVE